VVLLINNSQNLMAWLRHCQCVQFLHGADFILFVIT